MTETSSVMVPLGTKAPTFNLIDTISGKPVALDQLPAKIATVVIFMCNHCPYVQHILPHLIQQIPFYQSKDIQFIAINSNDVKRYPEDGPDAMQKVAEKLKFTFPYLYDETQEVAKAYHAACTPEFFVFDRNLACVYRGRYDDATPGNQKKVTGKDLLAALDALLSAKIPSQDQKPSLGCNIKWK